METERLSAIDLPLGGLKLLRRDVLGDARGNLQRLYCARSFAAWGIDTPLAQINLTYTATAGTVRGMHFQRPPHAEMKVVTCVRGRIFDVAVDIRKASATFLRWHAVELSAETATSLLIPEGFAHGFQALSDDCEVLYFHSRAYEAGAEGGLRPSDPRLAIAWPMAVRELSPRDASHPLLGQEYEGVDV